MIYSDGTHLVGDTVEELHDFAGRLGLKFEWFQDKNIPHYDLMGRMKKQAFNMGAKYLPKEGIVTKFKDHCFRCGNSVHPGDC